MQNILWILVYNKVAAAVLGCPFANLNIDRAPLDIYWWPYFRTLQYKYIVSWEDEGKGEDKDECDGEDEGKRKVSKVSDCTVHCSAVQWWSSLVECSGIAFITRTLQEVECCPVCEI